MNLIEYIERHGGFPRCRHVPTELGACLTCHTAYPCEHAESERESQREIMGGLFDEWTQLGTAREGPWHPLRG